MLRLVLLVVLVGRTTWGQHMAGEDQPENIMKLAMPGARPETDDSYMCTAFDVTELSGGRDTVYVTGFTPNADASKAHHMLLYGCQQPLKPPGEIYDCLHHTLCNGASSIMFAWAKNAPPTVLPKGVGFKIDTSVKKYLVLQVHYAKPLPEPDSTGLNLVVQSQPTPYTAGMLLMVQGGITIPAHTAVTHADVNCEVPSKVPLHMFAFRTHAHGLGTVITGYAYNEEQNEYREIARGSPQWPQAFYPMKSLQTVKPGEILAARCTYNSSATDHDTNIGPSGGDEMCNLYIMFFTEPDKVADFLTCVNEQVGSQITRNLPADSDVPPAANHLLEMKAKNSSVNTGISQINYEKLFSQEMDSSESKKKGGLEEGVMLISDYNFTMPGAVTGAPEEYLCTGLDIGDLSPDDPLWIVKFSAIVQGDKAHHIILAKCKAPPGKEGDMWDCRHHHICQDESKVLFAWAKHAEPTSLPEGVGFSLADDDHLVLQVHYATTVTEPDHSGLQIRFSTTKPKYTAGIMLLGRSQLDIPARRPVTHGDANCMVKAENPLHMFAYRVHAHNFGSVITGYRYNKKSKDFQLLAKGNPNWPQAFYPMEKQEWVYPGEYVHARCTFNTTTTAKTISIGPSNGDEMCNLYLMYYTLSDKDDFKLCFDEENTGLAFKLPAGNDVPLPRNPMLEHQAAGEAEQPQSFANGAHQQQEQHPPGHKKADQTVQKRPGVEDNSGRDPKALPGSDYSAVANWPTKDTATSLGQLSGVAIDIYGNAVVFHRGDRVWNGNTFNGDNTYGGDRNSPIAQDTVLTINSTGHIINSWGKDLFFLPHMITVDSQNNVWMTDVALHQVFKFGPYGGDHKPLIVLGERFVPGSDDRHYCKPTAVAVSKDTNTFFVSDGYCNSRIIKYSVTVAGDGKHEVTKATEWGKGAGPFSITKGPYSFNVPHGLALAEDRNEICVADRENGRVQCFSTETGELTKSVQPAEFGSRIFSVAYTPANGGKLHAVSGPEFSLLGKKPIGYIVDMASGNLEGTWQVPGGLQNPHDIAVSADGGTVYAVELQPYIVWKLTNGQPSSVLPSAPQGTAAPAAGMPNLMEGAKKLVPEMSGSVMIAAAISVPLTLLIACCLACRKCRKRGKGKLFAEPNKKKNWNVGDILGRSKDGFQPVNTDEREGMLGDDSESEVEEFSVPAMHA